MTDSELRDFVQNGLPPRNRSRKEEVLKGLAHARDRYERYARAREQWQPPKRRKSALVEIRRLSEGLRAALGNLDPISKDDLNVAIGSDVFDRLHSCLSEIILKSNDLAKDIRTDGRPRDLARERWIHEVADIYENNFGRKAALYGRNSGPFYRLLHNGMPESFPRHGSLDPRQIKRVLDRRK